MCTFIDATNNSIDHNLIVVAEKKLDFFVVICHSQEISSVKNSFRIYQFNRNRCIAGKLGQLTLGLLQLCGVWQKNIRKSPLFSFKWIPQILFYLYDTF